MPFRKIRVKYVSNEVYASQSIIARALMNQFGYVYAHFYVIFFFLFLATKYGRVSWCNDFEMKFHWKKKNWMKLIVWTLIIFSLFSWIHLQTTISDEWVSEWERRRERERECRNRKQNSHWDQRNIVSFRMVKSCCLYPEAKFVWCITLNYI